jgi:hypothetical protein
MEKDTKYRGVLARFFSFLHGVEYNREHQFTEDELNAVSHADVINYFKFKCFGTPNPNYNNRALVCACRVETIEYWKRSISYFYRAAGLENKTQCPLMNEFVGRIKKMEVRGKGQVSNARRPLQHREFVHQLHWKKHHQMYRY